ncbi:sugar ABC transporter substrate-binding protein [Blautia producta]|uniref:ABC transporter substrate-binding protein YesO n=1 Tax=Blautia producta TaxID=33035 RepID=A0A4P6M0K0_9FIRM|nr:sugar ABC transporter substrate-binding protein [Blautia producta]QBE97812.1 Putative ABC transporter substrate-binding protein YesO [Blautia producta]
MKTKKVLALTVSAAMIASLGLAGCGNSKNNAGGSDAKTESKGDSDSVTLKWVSQGPGEDSWEGLTKPILEEYEKETGVHIDAEFYSFNDLFEVIETKAAAGNTDFDVMSVDVTYIAKYGTSGYLEPLDKYFSDEDKAKWDDASYQAGVWEDTMYAAPENTSTQELYYNKTLLDKAGITIPENDENNRLTYEQVADLAKQALEKLDPDGTQGLIGFDFQQVSRVYQMNMLANAMGGKNISDDGYSLDGVVNTEPWINAMTWYQGLVNDGIASKGYDADQLGDQFYAGKMLFIIGGTWTPMSMKADDEIGSTYAPCFEGYEDKAATSTGSWYFGINSNSKNKDAAADFIKWFTLEKGNDMWLDINGDVPSRLEKQDEIKNDPDASNDMKIAAYEAAHTAVPRAVTPVFGEYSTVLDQAWEDVRNGADVKETLDNAIEQFESAIAAYKK